MQIAYAIGQCKIYVLYLESPFYMSFPNIYQLLVSFTTLGPLYYVGSQYTYGILQINAHLFNQSYPFLLFVIKARLPHLQNILDKAAYDGQLKSEHSLLLFVAVEYLLTEIVILFPPLSFLLFSYYQATLNSLLIHPFIDVVNHILHLMEDFKVNACPVVDIPLAEVLFCSFVQANEGIEVACLRILHDLVILSVVSFYVDLSHCVFALAEN